MKEHEEQIKQNTDDITELKKQMKALQLENEEMRKKLNTKPIHIM